MKGISKVTFTEHSGNNDSNCAKTRTHSQLRSLKKSEMIYSSAILFFDPKKAGGSI